MNVLIVEDDPTLSKNIAEAIKSEGMIPHQVFDGLLAERMMQKLSFDCIIMDINLPGKTGFDLCRSFRKRNLNTPIIMLTAFGELEDKVQGFDCGADDYLTKPFFIRELLLRIQALIKRAQMPHDPSLKPNVIAVDDIRIHTDNKTVFRQEQEISLTPREYQILCRLLRTPGEVVSKKELITEIWGHSFSANTNTIEVYANFLRKKVDKPFGRNSIRTKIGFGYYFDTDSQGQTS